MTDISETPEAPGDSSQTRRRFLTAATSAVGIGGAAGVAVPFLGSWNPLGESQSGWRAGAC
jgi:ubiquinol-cytochrome c reductase iron-sulfur subunit